jgi:hypothetical protein
VAAAVALYRLLCGRAGGRLAGGATDLMIALADMQRERDAWRAGSLASREQPPGFAISF